MAIYRPCPNHITCPAVTRLQGQGVIEDPDSPFMNFSSEAPDPVNYLGVFYNDYFPPPDSPYQWSQIGGPGSPVTGYFGGTSQQHSDDNAKTNGQDAGWNNQQEPPGTPWTSGPGGSPPDIFENAAVTCGEACEAGGTYEYTVEAGTVHALTQEEADALAVSLCAERKADDPLCIGNETLAGGCLNEAYSEFITVSGGTPFTDQVPPYSYLYGIGDGALPNGLELDVYTGEIYGSPDTGGNYTFTVTVMDSVFNTTSEQFSIDIVEITSGTLEGAVIGTNYSQQLIGVVPAGCTGVWSITGGTLPAGLTLDPATGIISSPLGTGPDAGENGDHSFQVTLTVTCP